MLIAFAVAAPSLLAFNLSPSATLLNQLLAVAAWGGVLVGLAGWVPAQTAWGPGAARQVRAPLLGLGLLALGVGVSWAGSLPASLASSALALLGVSALLLLAAQAGPVAGGAPNRPWAMAVLGGLALAGVLGSLVGVVQVFFPAWADGVWIARSGLPGRAVGNLRQPNHLSTQIMWGLIAWVPLAQAWAAPAGAPGDRRMQQARAALAGGAALLMVLGVVLSASRTGLVGVLMLALWGLLDRGLPRPLRVALGLAPVAYVLCWLGVAAWAHEAQQAFGGEARLAENDLASSRVGIWLNTLALIQAQPWTGVGFGNFNFAWTLTPFPGRPVAFFDHSHNLVLQLLVELGLPLGGAVLATLVWAVWQGWRRSGQHGGLARTAARSAWMLVLLVGVHSLLEYPLWYAYFLLPTAWALGHCLRAPTAPAPSGPLGRWLLGSAGALMLSGAAIALGDYLRVVIIYEPGGITTPLAERIAHGHESVFFAHQAGYAAVTTGQPAELREAALRTSTHALLDTRLMIAWAEALDQSGQTAQAQHLADRLREFRNPGAKGFFAPCEAQPAPSPLPYPCQAAPAGLGWRDFTATGGAAR
jgi:O-antigen ligase